MITLIAKIGFDPCTGRLGSSLSLSVGHEDSSLGKILTETVWEDTEAQAEEFARILRVAAGLRSYLSSLAAGQPPSSATTSG